MGVGYNQPQGYVFPGERRRMRILTIFLAEHLKEPTRFFCCYKSIVEWSESMECKDCTGEWKEEKKATVLAVYAT